MSRGLQFPGQQAAMSMSGDTDFLRAALAPQLAIKPQAESNLPSPLLFLKSAVSSGTWELFGGLPAPDVDKYRAENPVAGVISQFAGEAPFWTLPIAFPKLAFSLATKLPVAARALRAADALAGAERLGFAEGALREFARFAPFEAARVGGSLFVSDEGSVGRAAGGALLGLTGASLIGGASGAILARRGARLLGTSAAERENISRIEERVALFMGPRFNKNASAQEKIQQILPELSAVGPNEPILGDMKKALENLYRRVDIEVPVTGRYISPLPPRRKPEIVDGLFRGGILSGFRTGYEKVSQLGKLGFTPRSLTLGEEEGGFKTIFHLNKAKSVLNKISPQDDWRQYTQYLRYLDVNSEEGRKFIGRALDPVTGSFRRVGDNEWMIRESDDGLYIILKRFNETIPRGSAKGNILSRASELVKPLDKNEHWFILKTTKPSSWLPDHAGLTETLANRFVRGREWRYAAKVDENQAPSLKLTRFIGNYLLGSSAAMHAGRGAARAVGQDADISPFRQGLMSLLPKHMVKTRAVFDTGADLARGWGDTLRGALAPADKEFARNPRALAMWEATRRRFDLVNERVREIIEGPINERAFEPGVNVGKGIIRPIFGGAPHRSGGLRDQLERLIPDGSPALRDFNRIKMGALSVDEAVEQGLHSDAIDAARILFARDLDYIREVAITARALGIDDVLVPNPTHYQISGSWIGHHRLPLYLEATRGQVGEGRTIVGFGSGHTVDQAYKDAQRIIETINAEEKAAGRKPLLSTYTRKRDIRKPGDAESMIVEEEIFTHGDPASIKKDFVQRRLQAVEKDFPEAIRRAREQGGSLHAVDPVSELTPRQMDIMGLATLINTSDPIVRRVLQTRHNLFALAPERFKPGTSLLGGVGRRLGQPFTFSDVMDNLVANTIEGERFLARQQLALGPLKEEFQLLKDEDYPAAVRLARRFNAASGIQGPIPQAINSAVDRVMAPMLGPGSADRLVRGMNQTLFGLTLGGGDFGFVALNTVTPIQTVMPHIAYALRTPPERLMGNISFQLIQTPNGGLEAVGFLDPMRVMYRAAKDFFNPDAATAASLTRALKEGIISRPYIEEIIGGDLQRVLSGKGNIAQKLEKIVASPIAASEEASRAYAFLAGRRTAMDFHGMGEEAAYEYARQITMRTMYGYTTADRSRIITGAVGSGWGLFKNWTFHFAANLLTYTGEASRGNWWPLAYAMMGTGIVGGAAAVPFYGMADSFMKIWSDKSLRSHVYELFGNPDGPLGTMVPDGMMYGFPGVLQFSLQGRASAPGAAILRDMSMFGNMALFPRAIALKDAFWEGLDAAGRGQNPFLDNQFRDQLALAFAPRTLQRWMQISSGEGLKSLRTQNKLLPSLTTWQSVQHIFGFTPLEVEKMWDIQGEAWEDQNATRAKIQEYGEELADAWEQRDSRGAKFILRRAFQDRVMLGSVIRSAKTRMSKRNVDLLQRQFGDYQLVQNLKAAGL